jgi:hypothetical protein
LIEIGIFELPNNYFTSLVITAANQKGTLYFYVSITERFIKIDSIENANWQELKDFLKKHNFNRYETHKMNTKYFNLVDRLKTELYGKQPQKVKSQERILFLWKRLYFYNEALDLNELALEFGVSHSQLVRDIAILRRVFENREIRYNRVENTYELK